MPDAIIIKSHKFGRRTVHLTRHAVQRWAERVQGAADLDAALESARLVSTMPSYVNSSDWHRALAVGFIELETKDGGWVVNRDPSTRQFFATTFVVQPGTYPRQRRRR